MQFVERILRFVFSWIDSMLYGLVSIITNGFFGLAYIEVFNSDSIKGITARIYVVLAVFMIFKLAFSLIQYLVNPDQVNDKQAGMGKLAGRTFTALIMLVAIPILFDEILYGKTSNGTPYQEAIVKAIPNIIVGSSGQLNSAESSGEYMAKTAFAAFVTPNTDEGKCEDDVPELDPNNETVGSIQAAVMEECESDKSIFKYNYQFGISTIVGLVMVLIMLFFTVDIAIRAIKLGILRVVAPIPIISYIDPKSAKDGSFNNWLKALISTYLELFIKMAIIYIIIFVITRLTNGGISFNETNFVTKGYLTVFLIIGLLFFAMQASAFIKNIFGIKDQGGLGVGLGMLLGGAGALFAGGGIAGMAQGMLQGGSAGSQGKASFDNFNKGKELAAKTASGKATAARREQAKVQKRAEKVGYGKERLDGLEQEAANAANELMMAQQEYGHNPSEKNKQKLKQALAKNAAAKSAYEKAKKIADNPWLAEQQGKAYTKSGYARALFANKVGATARSFGANAGAWAQDKAASAYSNSPKWVQNGVSAGAALVAGAKDAYDNSESKYKQDLYEQDRINGGKYIDYLNDAKHEGPRNTPGSYDYSYDTINDFNYRQNNSSNSNNNQGQGGLGGSGGLDGSGGLGGSGGAGGSSGTP